MLKLSKMYKLKIIKNNFYKIVSNTINIKYILKSTL